MKSSIVSTLRKDIQFSHELVGHNFHFRSSWGIFSPREIDEGTILLLKHIKINPDDACFDLGCGYGPIGMAMAHLAKKGQTLMVDKDFVAVDYANQNARTNALSNCQAQLSNAFQHIEPDLRFDVIASNVPAKVGKEMMHIILEDAHHHLKEEGRLYFVTINGLREYMKKNLKRVFGEYKKLKQGKNYTVHMAQKSSKK